MDTGNSEKNIYGMAVVMTHYVRRKTGFAANVHATTAFRSIQAPTEHFFFVATASSGTGPPHSRGLQITQNDGPQSIGFLWTSD
jgi:hypothetical protein